MASGNTNLNQNYQPVQQAYYDPTGKQFVSPQAGPVVTSSDGTNYAPHRTGKAAVVAYSTTQTGISASGNSGDITVDLYTELVIDVNLTALTGTSVAFVVSRKDAFGNYVSIYAPSALTTTGTVAQTIGVGAETNKGFGTTVRIAWTCTAVTSATFTVSLQGK